MKRSEIPLPSGARTKEGLDPAPRKAISFWKSRLMYWEPWSWRMASPGAAPLADSAEAGTDASEQGFPSLEAGGAAGGMDPDEFAGAVVHRDEDRHLAVPEGGGGGGVGAPHHIRGLGADGSGVVAEAAGAAPALRRQQARLPASGAPPKACPPHLARPQAAPTLSGAPTRERRQSDLLPEPLDQFRVGEPGLRPPPPGRFRDRGGSAGADNLRRRRDRGRRGACAGPDVTQARWKASAISRLRL